MRGSRACKTVNYALPRAFVTARRVDEPRVCVPISIPYFVETAGEREGGPGDSPAATSTFGKQEGVRRTTGTISIDLRGALAVAGGPGGGREDLKRQRLRRIRVSDDGKHT